MIQVNQKSSHGIFPRRAGARALLVAAVLTLTGACASHSPKVGAIDPTTGYLPGAQKADILKWESADLDRWSPLLLATGGGFMKAQAESLGFFDEVMDLDDLQVRIVRAGLQDKVPSLDGPAGINNAYRHYKEFLWLRYSVRQQGDDFYARFIITNPETLEDLLIAERYLDYRWPGVDDKTTWYPLFNTVIDYLRDNSDSYRKGPVTI